MYYKNIKIHIKNVLYFISILHVILKKIFFLFFLFCCLVSNEYEKIPGFYTLQVKMVFLNFPQ